MTLAWHRGPGQARKQGDIPLLTRSWRRQPQSRMDPNESLWSMLKRAHKGTFHKLSPKHLDRYVQELAGMASR